MNDCKELYKIWKAKAADPEIASQLAEMEGSDELISDSFRKSLEFGTGGLRGTIGAGTNRMNIYTVGQATQGLADYLNEEFDAPAVVIGHDSRINSDVFAEYSARVLAANGIKTYLFPELIPTPVVAWAVTRLGCKSGIMITASHNPSKDNGYKCYDARGYQMTDEAADRTLSFISKCDIFDGVKVADKAQAEKDGLIEYINEDLLKEYYSDVLKCRIHPDAPDDSGLSVIYSPLNGTGNKPVRHVLKEAGYDDVTVVPEQEMPDGNFPTCPSPNPEYKATFERALKLAETKKADLLIATDPDCDRVGTGILTDDGYVFMTGNEIGCLMADYILSGKKESGTLSENSIVIKSIVTTELAAAISDYYGAKTVNVLTGFKYIGEIMAQLALEGKEKSFIMGFEESYGYLTGMHTRDKDAVNASLIVCEMAAYYKKQGRTLVDVMDEIYARFGTWVNSLFSHYYNSPDGMEVMLGMMEKLRGAYPASLGGNNVTAVTDYKTGLETDTETGKTTAVTLPVSNVISLSLGSDKVVVRPSGTESKIKVYFMVSGKSKADAEEKTAKYKKDITALLGIGE